MAKSTEPKVYYVEWVDASAISGWTAMNSTHISIYDNCKAIGFLVKNDKKEIVLASAYCEDEVNGIICIPKSWVRKIKRVNV